MESKVSEGGLNVTLTIRLLMHGKVTWGRNQGTARQGFALYSLCYSLKTATVLHVQYKLHLS